MSEEKTEFEKGYLKGLIKGEHNPNASLYQLGQEDGYNLALDDVLKEADVDINGAITIRKSKIEGLRK